MDDRGHSGKLRVAIIGAGFSGLSVAHYIRKEIGLQSFVIYDKSPPTNGGAGTWKDNTYPGCACDVPIHLYSMSWAKRWNWTEYLPLQPEIQEYLDDTAKSHGLVRHMQYSTELLEAKWIDDEGMWALKLRNVGAHDPEDAVYTVKHHVVVLACGPLSQVKMPEGIDRSAFKGEQFHSAKWRHDISLENKRVAVVGNGCSATQLMPIIARKTKSLTQYVSSPQWYVPRANPLYTDLEKAAFRYIPGAMQFHRWKIAYNWESQAINLQGNEKGAQGRKAAEGFLLSYMKSTAPEKYHERLTPKYPMGCKRLVFDSNYYSSLHADNVDIAFTRVDGLHENGVVAADGQKKDFDVIIWATGFLATMFYESIKIYGRSGNELHDVWNGKPTAYAGVQIADLPNLYTTTGPNTFSGHYPLTAHIEFQAQYISRMLKMQLENDVKSFEVTQEAQDEYNVWLRRKLKGMVWSSADCNSWFKDADGFVPTNFPGKTTEYWSKVFYPNMDHQHQVGGTKKVQCTTLKRELVKNGTSVIALLAMVGYGIHNRNALRNVLSTALSEETWRSLANNLFTQAKGML